MLFDSKSALKSTIRRFTVRHFPLPTTRITLLGALSLTNTAARYALRRYAVVANQLLDEPHIQSNDVSNLAFAQAAMRVCRKRWDRVGRHEEVVIREIMRFEVTSRNLAGDILNGGYPPKPEIQTLAVPSPFAWPLQPHRGRAIVSRKLPISRRDRSQIDRRVPRRGIRLPSSLRTDRCSRSRSHIR
jgi:hypothetical protein